MIIESIHVNDNPFYIIYIIYIILAFGFSIHLFLYTVIYDNIIYYRGVHGFDKNYPLDSPGIPESPPCVQHLS